MGFDAENVRLVLLKCSSAPVERGKCYNFEYEFSVSSLCLTGADCRGQRITVQQRDK